jgi:hypothetical protein
MKTLLNRILLACVVLTSMAYGVTMLQNRNLRERVMVLEADTTRKGEALRKLTELLRNEKKQDSAAHPGMYREYPALDELRANRSRFGLDARAD